MRCLCALLLIVSCAKKEEPLESQYRPPALEWDEEIDLDDLPEADDTGVDEEILR